jgi:hypothetical protein
MIRWPILSKADWSIVTPYGSSLILYKIVGNKAGEGVILRNA